ncbi:MAG: type II toxin-antitoxin system VapC family toxin [Ardenticatenia bacterium]|nr:type II toxin-antitoxin system VapC family toxin [Ardenticatenia bacterium]
MNDDRIFLDTFFVQALLNQRDRYHLQARALLPRVRAASEVWITDAILVEIGNALSAVNRAGALAFIRQCGSTPNLHLVEINALLMDRALALYESRSDKTWGMTDCLSFVVMDDQGLLDAATADGDFRQAGFRPLMGQELRSGD